MAEVKAPQSESRDRVLQAAYALFLHNGLTAVSMQQIADDAGITKATLYHHFRDKHDLYIETMRLAIINNEHALAESLRNADDINDIVRALLTFVFGDGRSDLQRLAADFKQHVDQESQSQFWLQFQLPWRLVQSAVENLEEISPKEAEFISRYLYGAAAGLSQLYRFEAETHPIDDDMLNQLATLLLHGLPTHQ